MQLWPSEMLSLALLMWNRIAKFRQCQRRGVPKHPHDCVTGLTARAAPKELCEMDGEACLIADA